MTFWCILMTVLLGLASIKLDDWGEIDNIDLINIGAIILIWVMHSRLN